MKKILIGGVAFALLVAQAPGQRRPRHDAAAVIKLIAVRVLDAEGRPVAGLRRDDFVVTDNGARQNVTEFESYVLGEAGTELAAADKEAAAQAPLLKRRLFIFLDLQGSDVDGLKNAKAAALYFVDTQLRPGDEVGVVGFSPMRGFFIQEYLTTDHKKVRQAIERARELPPGAGSTERAGPDDGGRGPGLGVSCGRGSVVAGGDTGFTTETHANPDTVAMTSRGGSTGSFIGVNASVSVPGTGKYAVTDFVPRMFDLAETLKYVPGNKSLVLFSGRDLGAAAKSLGQSFASSGTPVYAVNTKNWIMKGVMSYVKERHLYLEHSLKDLASASGGEYFADVEAVREIAGEVQALSANFYVLGYYVKEDWDGKFHKVAVELAKPGYRVLAQAGYYNPKPYAEMTDFEKEIHLFGLLSSDAPSTAAMELAAAEVGAVRAEGRAGVVLVEAFVDPKAGVPPARVELIALIRDEDRVPVVSRKWEIDLSAYNGKTLLLSFASPQKPGRYDGRVIVRDMETGQPAAGRFVFVAAAAAAEEGVILSSPVILVPGQASKLVRLQHARARRGQPAEPTIVDLYPFIPRDMRIVVRDLDAETGRLTALLPIRVRASAEGGAPRVEVGAALLFGPGREDIPLEVEVVEAKTAADGREFLVLRIALPRPGPGACTLEITAAEAASGRKGSVRTALVLK